MSEGWPRVAASMAVFRGGQVLLGERGKGALAGRWSLPGGHIEPGETARQAALREVREETGVEADLVGLVDIHDIIHRDPDGIVVTHYLVTVFCGVWTAGEPEAADDCRHARFVGLSELGEYPLTDSAARIISAARQVLIQAGRWEECGT